MKVKLTVVQGKPEGKEFVLPVNPFVIGRGKKCHLRPNHPAIGERHCAIIANASTVVVRDLGSDTGTLINGQKIEGDVAVNSGDLLQVGPLVFAVTLIASQRETKSTAPKAPARTTQAGSASSSSPAQPADEDIDVTDWLGGAEAPLPASPEGPAEKAPAAGPAPVFDDMDLPAGPATESAEAAAESESDSDSDSAEQSKEKPSESQTASTSRAASDLLRRYFTRPRDEPAEGR